MKTGNFTRTFETNQTKWIVEGFSNQSKCYVYPHEGWSWTDWQPEITDTYKSLDAARKAISGGYLHDMIETQRIVDIRIYEIVTSQTIVEYKTARAYDRAGNPEDFQEPRYTYSTESLSTGDYLILEGDLYGTVRFVRDGQMGFNIINGYWTLILDTTGPVPVIDVSSPRMGKDRVGRPVRIMHIGIPDESADREDYNWQLNFYKENFDQDVLTSTLRTAKLIGTS